MKIVLFLFALFLIPLAPIVNAQYMGNVGDEGETGSNTLEENLKKARERIEKAEPSQSISCGEGTKLEDGQCVVDPNFGSKCGSGTKLEDGKCVVIKPTSTNTNKELWVKYDLSLNLDSSSILMGGNQEFTLSQNFLPFDGNTDLADTQFLKMKFTDISSDSYTVKTYKVKNDGIEEFMQEQIISKKSNLFVIDPNVSIGDTLNINDFELTVREFSTLVIGDKEVDVIKATQEKTFSSAGSVGKTTLNVFYHKNTGIPLLTEAKAEVSSRGEHMNMNLVINAVDISDSLLQKSSNGTIGSCLIATATYGSELSPQVQQLREIRDSKLLQTESGTAFMESFNSFYYSFSPHIANYERENPVFREAVKLAITPMISSLSILNYVDMDSEHEVLGYGISLLLLNIGMYVGIPAFAIIGIRKRF